MDTLGIVLAGGASRRMELSPGHSKADLSLGGRTLLEHVCRAVRPEVDRLVVVAGQDQGVPSLPEIDAVIRDSQPAGGPLAGIADALREADAAMDRVFVTSCDVPLLMSPVVRFMLDRLSPPGVLWAVPMFDGHPQMLASAMRPGILPAIEAFLAAGRRDLRGLMETLMPSGTVALVSHADLEQVDPAGVSFADADTPEDLARLDAILPRLPPSRR